MTGLVPQSWGSPLREFNQCHSPADGKFCSTGVGTPGWESTPGGGQIRRYPWSHDATLVETLEGHLPMREVSAHLAGLDEKTRQGLIDVSRWSESVRTLNNKLRKDRSVPVRLRALFGRVTTAIESAPPLPPTVVWRGMSGDKPGLLSLGAGSIVALKGIQSTSLDPMVAAHRALIYSERLKVRRPTKRHTPVLLRIETTRGLYLKPISIIEREKEMLLGHNWRYEVVSIQRKTRVPSGDPELADSFIDMVVLRALKA